MSRPTATTTRQNEYFVPRDGIDREVISADICRYLGNDALVRPGHYENPQTGQPVQGYYITAYRNLTTAMIEDLKADSARWDRERRAQTSRSGGIFASTDAPYGAPRQLTSDPNTVQYRYSETHQSRQHHGPTDPPYREDPYARDAQYEQQPRYPGTGAPGYTGAAGAYQPQQQGYAPPSGGAYGGGGGGGGYQQPQQSPGPQGAGYAPGPQGGPMMNQGYQGPDQPRAGSNVAAPLQPIYATGPPPLAGYPAPNYQYPSQAPTGTSAYAMQPQDPFFGRGASPSSSDYPNSSSDVNSLSDFVASPAGQTTQPPQGYPAQGYEETPAPARTSATPSESQTPPRESSNRLSDRETDRHHRPPRR
ncbi:hypothetical protein PT974_01356 [Cladobotryum mycophilum]|uniref:Transcription factor RfeG n=1 Tax=Cladobotryum mycophilum TaxID=491253 RepID=A0ABR0T4C8_9HYPO